MKKLFALIFLSQFSALAWSAADVSGQVLASDGNPVAGASVYLEGSDGTNVTISDAKGNFLFECVDGGSYGVTAHSQELSSERFDVQVSSQDVALYTTLTRVDSSRQVKIKARSLAADQADLAMTLEMPVSEIERGPEDSLQIKAALSGLPQGSYEVVVSSPGMAYVGTLDVQQRGERTLKNGIVIDEKDYSDAVATQQASLGIRGHENL